MEDGSFSASAPTQALTSENEPLSYSSKGLHLCFNIHDTINNIVLYQTKCSEA